MKLELLGLHVGLPIWSTVLRDCTVVLFRAQLAAAGAVQQSKFCRLACSWRVRFCGYVVTHSCTHAYFSLKNGTHAMQFWPPQAVLDLLQ